MKHDRDKISLIRSKMENVLKGNTGNIHIGNMKIKIELNSLNRNMYQHTCLCIKNYVV
jgi:hypothetical protein